MHTSHDILQVAMATKEFALLGGNFSCVNKTGHVPQASTIVQSDRWESLLQYASLHLHATCIDRALLLLVQMLHLHSWLLSLYNNSHWCWFVVAPRECMSDAGKQEALLVLLQDLMQESHVNSGKWYVASMSYMHLQLEGPLANLIISFSTYFFTQLGIVHDVHVNKC